MSLSILGILSQIYSLLFQNLPGPLLIRNVSIVRFHRFKYVYKQPELGLTY